jgi:hypothetical protein
MFFIPMWNPVRMIQRPIRKAATASRPFHPKKFPKTPDYDRDRQHQKGEPAFPDGLSAQKVLDSEFHHLKAHDPGENRDDEGGHRLGPAVTEGVIGVGLLGADADADEDGNGTENVRQGVQGVGKNGQASRPKSR